MQDEGGAAQLKQALEALGVTVWRVDWATGRAHFHPLAAPPVGLGPAIARDGLTIDEVRALLHPDDRQAIEDAATAARRSSAAIDLVARYRMQDGHWAPLLTRRIAERDADGRPLALLGLSMDVEHFVAEREALLHQRERVAELADAAGLGIWHRSGPPGSAEWNDAMLRIYGRRRDQGTPSFADWCEQIVHPLDVARFRADQERCETEWLPVFHTEFRVRTADGRVKWIYAWSRRGERDGQRYAFGMHIDITERRQAEQALGRAHERELFALQAAGIGVWRRRLDRSEVIWNHTMYRLRGLDPADPRPIKELTRLTLHPDDHGVMDDLTQRLLPDGQPYEREYRVVWPSDGSVHWIATRGRVVEDEDGAWMAGINVDVTERREAEALRTERERLEQSRLAQSAFLARVSHELRTPLNAVLGFAQLLGIDRQELSPRQADRVQRIETAGRHLLALIDDVLDLARIEADQQPIELAPVALDEVARQALGWVGALAHEAGIQLRIEDAALPGTVLAERRRLGQVVINLLTNAIKYNRDGGHVEIRTRSDGARHALEVCDSGRGMTAEQCRRAFEPFDRLGVEDEGIEGTGIGLTIVRQLVHRMGGEVRVHSTPGEGSTFAVWLAAAPQPCAPATPATARTERATALPALRVLCIDDHATNLQLVRDLLALRPGTLFEGAASGRAGLAAAAAQPPDVVLLDLQLPDLHGTEVLAQLRAMPALAGCRMIALSANAMPADVSAALAKGFDDYWTKPIDARRFLAGIDALARPQP
jgi:PAS domain S-box-containing protein